MPRLGKTVDKEYLRRDTLLSFRENEGQSLKESGKDHLSMPLFAHESWYAQTDQLENISQKG